VVSKCESNELLRHKRSVTRKDAIVVEGKRGRKRKGSAPVVAEAKRTRKSEMEVAESEIEALGLEDHCSILQF
jgi:hypothetical protein